MSENTDLVRSIYAAWERRDYRSAEWAHSEIEYVNADGPDRGRRVGLEEMAEAWRRRTCRNSERSYATRLRRITGSRRSYWES